jgi:hypothetical protein
MAVSQHISSLIIGFGAEHRTGGKGSRHPHGVGIFLYAAFLGLIALEAI